MKNVLIVLLLFIAVNSFGQVNYWFKYTKNVLSTDVEVQARALEDSRAQYTFRVWKFIPVSANKNLEWVVAPAFFYHKRIINSRSEIRFSTGLRQYYNIAGFQFRSRVLGDYRYYINENVEWRLRLQQSAAIPVATGYKIRPQVEWLITNHAFNEIRVELSAFALIRKKHELGLGYQEQIINNQMHHCLLLQFR